MNGDEPALGAPSARILQIIRSQYVEFEYCHGDPDLCVELIMPPAVFADFCRERGLDVHASDQAAFEGYRALTAATPSLPECRLIRGASEAETDQDQFNKREVSSL